MLGEQTQKISLNYYCRPTFAISKLKITLRRVLACYSVLSLFYSALLWINSMLLLLYESLFTVTFKHSLLPFLHDFPSINSSWQTLQRLLMQSFVSVTKEKFGRVSPLNVKALGKSDVRPCVSPAARSLNVPIQQALKDKPRKTHKARSINYSERRRLSEADKCVLQFHSCFSLQFKLEGGENGAVVVHYHALYLLKWTNPSKQMQFSKLNGSKSRQPWDGRAWESYHAHGNISWSGENTLKLLLMHVDVRILVNVGFSEQNLIFWKGPSRVKIFRKGSVISAFKRGQGKQICFRLSIMCNVILFVGFWLAYISWERVMSNSLLLCVLESCTMLFFGWMFV